MRNKTKMSRIVKTNRKTFILLTVVLLFFAYLIIQMLPMRSSFVALQNHTFTEAAKAYVFKNEEYVILNSAEKINFLVDESEKISASTLLSDNYKLSTNYYIKEKIETIEYVINNEDISVSSLNRQISNARAECEDINRSLQNGATPIEEKKAADRLYELQHNIYIMKRAKQYTYATNEELNELLAKYKDMLTSSDIPLTADNLNFTVFGSVYYTIDGYENYLNFEELNYLDVNYLNEIDSLSTNKNLSNDSYVLKSSSSSSAVVVLRLPNDVYVNGEEACMRIYADILENYDMDSEGGYFEFIFRRIDLLNIFPAFKFETSSGMLYDGELIKVSYYDNEKLLYVALRNDVLSLSGSRLLSAYAHVDSYDCYVIEKNCIFDKDGKSYVRAVKNGQNEEVIEVNVYAYENGKAYLKVSENENISDGDEIKLRGLL